MAALAAGLLACGDEGSDRGTAVFTTRGAAGIEQSIPADPSGATGFVDGWTLEYEKFLVVFYDIRLADTVGRVGARLFGSRFVDNVKPGPKMLVQFSDVPARSWDAVSYVIAPATYDTVSVSGEIADRDLMAANGYSLYVQGTASKNGVTKTFAWGFKTATAYERCQQPAVTAGSAAPGVVIANGSTDTTELTTRGDALFSDRLVSDPARPTRLRFDAIAAADVPGEGFGAITLEELAPVQLDATLYDAASAPAPVATLGEYVTSLARTVGHFRGDGVCAQSIIR